MQVPLLELLPLLLPPVPVVLAPTSVPRHALSALLDLGPLLDLLLLLPARAWLTTMERVSIALPVWAVSVLQTPQKQQLLPASAMLAPTKMDLTTHAKFALVPVLLLRNPLHVCAPLIHSGL
jgi:hypothetical protein